MTPTIYEHLHEEINGAYCPLNNAQYFGRVESPETWAGGIPNPFGTGTQVDYIYSIFAYYFPEGENLPPTANFTHTTNDLAADFTDTSVDYDGTVVSWHWNFGDGKPSTQQHPTHTYVVDGTYTVTLTATDNEGATGINVNIYRSGVLIATTANDGYYTDYLGKKASGTYTYPVCETDGSVCSNQPPVTF